ncbi:MAG: TIGR02206 family membrane protein [Verrucomicrobia bacterium]|nr:MAG: TIGR02206 family membrane protein [Verrucomicrobiota bacterium]
MDAARAFRPFGLAHLIVMALTISLPFVLAAFVRKSRWARSERIIARLFAVLLLANYVGYEIYLALTEGLAWQKALPFQLCDWAMVAIIVALLTGRERWLEVAYFWGIGGTLQAIITPDLKYAFPDVRFLTFFIAHSGIVVAIAFMMIVKRFRPHWFSIVRTFAWSELYFVIAITVDLLTGENYGYLVHKPAAASLLDALSDHRVVYILQMHLLALAFFVVLYLPFALYDLVRGSASHKGHNGSQR